MSKARFITPLLLTLLMIGCGNGGGGGGGAGTADSPAEPSQSYNVTLTAIEFKKKGSEETLPVDNLPLEGTTYTE